MTALIAFRIKYRWPAYATSEAEMEWIAVAPALHALICQRRHMARKVAHVVQRRR